MNYDSIQTPTKSLGKETPQDTEASIEFSQRDIFKQKMDAAWSVYLEALDLVRADFENDLEVASGNHGVETDEIVRGFYNQPFDDQQLNPAPPDAWGKSYSPEKLARFDDEKAAVNLKYRLALSDAQKKHEQARKEAKKEFDRQYQAIWDEHGQAKMTPATEAQPSSPRLAIVGQPDQSPQQANDHYVYQAA